MLNGVAQQPVDSGPKAPSAGHERSRLQRIILPQTAKYTKAMKAPPESRQNFQSETVPKVPVRRPVHEHLQARTRSVDRCREPNGESNRQAIPSKLHPDAARTVRPFRFRH